MLPMQMSKYQEISISNTLAIWCVNIIDKCNKLWYGDDGQDANTLEKTDRTKHLLGDVKKKIVGHSEHSIEH